jgi:uncharacterized protein (DUF697 family)
MTAEPIQPTESHPHATSLIAVCFHAAFADGENGSGERERIEDLGRELGVGEVSAVARRILMGRLSLEEAVAPLVGREDRMLAYEMARAVCESDERLTAGEQAFLESLRGMLSLAAEEAAELDAEVDQLLTLPVSEGAGEEEGAVSRGADPDLSGMILRYSILNGALELLPQTMATMAILPLQMKMVWRIGKAHGQELDRASIKEFLAAAGIGLGSQMMEGFARKLLRGVGGRLAGKMAGRVAAQATGSAFSFASTYAIGHLACRYHAAGRKLGADEWKRAYPVLVEDAKKRYAGHLPEIRQRAAGLDAASILALVRGSRPV